MEPLGNSCSGGGTWLALSLCMRSIESYILAACCFTAAVSGCGRATAPELSDAGDAPDGSLHSADGAIHENHGDTAGNPSDSFTAVCPPSFPVLGAACQIPQSMACTYRGDGPCSKSNPDRIAVCYSGTWGSVAAAIQCNPGNDGADAGGPDCDGPLPLSDFCSFDSQNCNQSLGTLTEHVCNPDATYYRNQTMRPNACGGMSLRLEFGLSGWRYDYDGSGILRSVEIADDVPSGVCMRFDNVYGTPCELTGTPAPACEAGPNDDAGI